MKLGLMSAAMIFVATNTMAQHVHNAGSPIETGQSQFAAIAEIVTLLQNDPETDWEQIDIKALREHLVDMDNVTTEASVARTVDGLNVTFKATGDQMIAGSIKRMVFAHSPMLQRSSDWIVTAEDIEGGALMQVQTASVEELNHVKGLGFFGLLTIGAHHQHHHLMIAMGRSPH